MGVNLKYMDYASAIEYLGSFIDYGITPGLERISKLVERVGNPQLDYPAIHITGTNGKTSTAKIATSILSSLGLKAGLYTSPHLERVNERIAVGNELISNESFSRILSRLQPEIEEVNCVSTEKLTYFEVLTALAFYYFKEEEVNCAVVEVGMGGRWDATNLIDSKVAVITNIEFDHTDILGNSLSAIAGEKLGILKPASCVVAAEQKPKMVKMIKEKCAQCKADLKILGRDFDVLSFKEGKIDLKGIYGTYNNLTHSLLGPHQATNMAMAVAACEAFRKEALPEEPLRVALKNISSSGRLEVVSRQPLVILDGAHNPHGVMALAGALNDFVYNKLILVLSILGDKDVESILQTLLPFADFTVVTQNKNSRALSSRELAGKVEKFTSDFQEVEEISAAVEMAVNRAEENDLVLITGSLYTVGEARAFLRRRALNSRFEDRD